MSAVAELPVDLDELRQVALLAHGALVIHAAQVYGLVEGGPSIDVTRCEDVIAVALERGAGPFTRDEIDAAAIALTVGMAG